MLTRPRLGICTVATLSLMLFMSALLATLPGLAYAANGAESSGKGTSPNGALIASGAVSYSPQANSSPSTNQIVYHLAGGAFSGSVPNVYVSGIGLQGLPTPKRTGYTFLGWYSDSKLTNHVNGITNKTRGKAHLYAKWRKRKLIAHRGYTANAPENSARAIIDAAKKGFKYVEVDVRFTRNKVPVLAHNPYVDLLVKQGQGTVKKRVRVSKVRYDALQQGQLIDKGKVFPGSKVMSFAAMIKLCKQLGVEPYLDIKEGTRAKIKSLVRTVKQYGMQTKVRWMSHKMKRLLLVKRYDKDANISLRVGYVRKGDILRAQKLRRGGSDVEIGIPRVCLNATGIRLCKAAAIPMEVWGVSNESSFKAIDPYISALMVNGLEASRVPATL